MRRPRRFADLLWRRRKLRGAGLTGWQGGAILVSIGVLVLLLDLLVYYVWFLPTLHPNN